MKEELSVLNVENCTSMTGAITSNLKLTSMIGHHHVLKVINLPRF